MNSKMQHCYKFTKPETTREFYGKYSFGNIRETIFSDESLQELMEIMIHDLKIAGVHDKIQDKEIMDVGTGRQALVFGLLKSKSVDHYDLSQTHVLCFKEILKSRYPELPITSNVVDLVEYRLPEKTYDFIYLNGIVHHLSNTKKGLINCAEAVKLRGRIWVYFYRSGTFKWMVCQMIRELLSPEEIDLYFACSGLLYSNGMIDNSITSMIMDDFFVPYIHLYPPHEYINFFNKLGFEVCGSLNLDPFSYLNHELNHHSAVLVFERTKNLSLRELHMEEMLIPEKSINQLDEGLYKDKQTREILRIFKTICNKLRYYENSAFKMSLCFALHKLAAPQYYGQKELPPRKEELFTILIASLEYLTKSE